MPSIHRPTLTTTLVIVVVLFVGYHFLLNKKD